MKTNDHKVKIYKYAGKTKVTISFEVENDKWNPKKEIASRLEKNIEWMANHLCNWADFDYTYTLDLFTDALKKLGEGLIAWDNVLHSKRNGRRAIAASNMLKKAYNFEFFKDESYKNWAKRKEYNHVLLKNGNIWMKPEYLNDNLMGMDREKYADKMFSIILDRNKREEKILKRDSWSFIHKYIEHWWD